MLSKYQDSNSLWHDEPCKNGKPSSNNWMIYTAYAKLLKLPYDKDLARKYFDQCANIVRDDQINIYRHPGKKEPPFSFDELLGAMILGLVPHGVLKENHYVFQGKGEPVSPQLAVKILAGFAELKIKEKIMIIAGEKPDRNTFWKKKVKNLYQAAYRVNPGQVWFLKKAAKSNNIHEIDRVLKNLYVEITLKNGTPGEKNILWALAKISGETSLAKKCSPKKNFGKYFPKDHPFNKAIK